MFHIKNQMAFFQRGIKWTTKYKVYRSCFMQSTRNILHFKYCHNASEVNNINQNNKQCEKNGLQDSHKDCYNVIFKYPHSLMSYVQLVSRFKIYHLPVMCMLCYPGYTMYIEETMSKGALCGVIGGAVAVSLGFIIFSYFSTKLIGELAVNKTRDTLKVSRLTFYGKRTADYHSVHSIVPWVEVSDSNNLKIFLQQQQQLQRVYIRNKDNSQSAYFYSLKYGLVNDMELFCNLFGLPTYSCMTTREETNQYWSKRWDEGTLTWHTEATNPFLEEFFHRFDEENVKGKRIIIPLCGKSVDMKWLYDKGMYVIGVDAVELSVKTFFEEQNLDYRIEEAILPDYKRCKVYCYNDRLRIYICDIFKLDDAVLGGPCDYLWDRGALVAIDYPEQQQYSKTIDTLLSPTAQGLIEGIAYDHALLSGPPYSVSKEEVVKFFSSTFSVEEICSRKETDLPEWYTNEKLIPVGAHRALYYIARSNVK